MTTTPIWISCACWSASSLAAAIVAPTRFSTDGEAISAWLRHWKAFISGGPRYWSVHGPSGHLLAIKEIDFVLPSVAAAHPAGCGRCTPAAVARSSTDR